ncbi:MAG TPA: SagB/ThcOx family dehydrogenase [Gammaproteobacteria bacterium]
MRIRRAATLACTFEGAEPVLHNFLTREMFACDARTVDVLAALDDWTAMDELLARLPGSPDAAAAILRELLARELVLVEASPAAERDARYRETWRWGTVAGFYHFGVRDAEFLDGEATVDRLRSFGGPASSPPLLASNRGFADVTALPAFDRDDDFFNVLYRRRSRRQFSGEAISQAVLADCLFAGNGYQETLDAGEFGRLPLTMTPSGGARNPFELYVYARNVDGLKPGFHHYSAAEHSLGFLHDRELPAPAALLGDQPWTNKAAAVIFLCADFPRPAWKYRQALAYRTVLMEVGCITQNIQLAATYRGIAAAPTGALAETAIEALLELEEITQAALFAVVLGAPSLALSVR